MPAACDESPGQDKYPGLEESQGHDKVTSPSCFLAWVRKGLGCRLLLDCLQVKEAQVELVRGFIGRLHWIGSGTVHIDGPGEYKLKR